MIVWLLGGGFVYGVVRSLPLGDVRQYLAVNASMIMLLLGVLIVHIFLHQRPLRALVTTRKAISWGRMFQGGAVWVAIMIFGVLLEAALFPGAYVLSFKVGFIFCCWQCF